MSEQPISDEEYFSRFAEPEDAYNGGANNSEVAGYGDVDGYGDVAGHSERDAPAYANNIEEVDDDNTSDESDNDAEYLQKLLEEIRRPSMAELEYQRVQRQRQRVERQREYDERLAQNTAARAMLRNVFDIKRLGEKKVGEQGNIDVLWALCNPLIDMTIADIRRRALLMYTARTPCGGDVCQWCTNLRALPCEVNTDLGVYIRVKKFDYVFGLIAVLKARIWQTRP